MRRNRASLAAFLAIPILGIGFTAAKAFAQIVNLDTGTAPWTVTRTLIGGETDPNTNGGDSAGDSETYTAVPVAAPLPGTWITPSELGGDGNAQWVSWSTTTGADYDGDNSYPTPVDDGTSYVFNLTFWLHGAPGDYMSLNSYLAADNAITGISLEDLSQDMMVPGTFTDNSLDNSNYFHFANEFDASELFQTGPWQQFSLTVDVVNWDTDRFNDPESTGLILTGTAMVVPEPTSFGLLFVSSMLLAARRRRRTPAKQLATSNYFFFSISPGSLLGA
jgi:hypothetical protein